jgi:hypothetical protein
MQSMMESTSAACTFCIFLLSIPEVLWHNQAAMIQMRRAERGCRDDQGTWSRLVSSSKEGWWGDSWKGGVEMTKGRGRGW